MIIPDPQVTANQIAGRREVPTLNGTSLSTALIQIETPNFKASNGLVHILSSVIQTHEWRDYTLRNVDAHVDLQEELSPLLDRIEFDEPLNDFIEATGTSWIACRDEGYSEEEAIAGGYLDVVQDLINPLNGDYQWQAYLYNLVDVNLYEQDIPRGYQALVYPRNAVAQMWITKDAGTGVLRFNNAELDRQELAENGITQIVTRPLVPPGMVQLVEYTAEYTTINMEDMVEYFLTSEWNPRDISTTVTRISPTKDATNFSAFIPLQDGFGEFNIEVGVRIRLPEWRRHLWDFLLHLLAPVALTVEEWTALVAQQPDNTMQVEMMSGFNTTFSLGSGGDLLVDGAGILRPLNMKAVDGYIHIVEQVPLPPSVAYTVYDQIQQSPDLTTLRQYIDTLQLGVFIDNLLPVTLFAPINSAWEGLVLPTLEWEDLLKNHIFEGHFFDDSLEDGQILTSNNGKEWHVHLLEGEGGPLWYAPDRPLTTIYITNLQGETGLTNCTIIPGRSITNVLARTGVIHQIDCLFLDKQDASPSVSPSLAPSNSPTASQQPSSSPSLSQAPSVSMSPSSTPTSSPQPSLRPSSSPSPSSSPTINPTSSSRPSAAPSGDPSMDPSVSMTTRSGIDDDTAKDKGDNLPGERGSTRTFLIKTTLTFYFSPRTGKDAGDLSSLIGNTLDFYKYIFRQHWGSSFVECQLLHSESNYNSDETPDEFELSFDAYTTFQRDTKATPKQLASVMADKHALREYVVHYARASGGVFVDTHKVFFRGVGSKGESL